MKCPSCGAASAVDAPECPACGLIFAKWREQALKALEPSAPAPARDPWLGRSIAALIVVLWLCGLALYFMYSLRTIRAA